MIQQTDTPVPPLIADVYRSDEQTGGRPTLSPDQVTQVRRYLEQLLLDLGDRLPQHIAALEMLYGARYAPPLPRSWRRGADLPEPRVAAEFRHSAALAGPLALAVAEGGVDRLPESELAQLLLNPHALWDLNDLINTLMPDYWLKRMEEVGLQLARESGIDPYQDFETTVGRKLAGAETAGRYAGPNLFTFATSKLSQDAFLCWLASWADPAYRLADERLHATASAFVDRLLRCGGVSSLAPPYRSVRVCRQFQDIDVLLLVNGDSAVIIEDKTHTKDQPGQLQRYKEVVRREFGLPDERIAGVYLKTGDQRNFDSVKRAGYGVFMRRAFLDILNQGVEREVKNNIFRDFHRHLHGVEESVQSYRIVPLEEWDLDWNRWKGFFQALQDQLPDGDWDYVPNRGGGFMGFWWHMRGDKYLQLENDKLCFKIEVLDKAQWQERWRRWNAALMARKKESDSLRISNSLRRPGRNMTVAVLEGDYRQANEQGLLDMGKTVKVLERAAAFMDEAMTAEG